MNNKYEIAEFIGNGKFGKVFRGIKRANKEAIAIKIEIAENPMSKFIIKHESTVLEYLGRKKIKNIPQLYWFGQIKHDISALVITYYDKPFTIADLSIAYFIQLVSALEHIHGAGIIHRDVKLANLMLKNNVIYLIDFGLAITESPNEIGETVLGTPNYMSWNIHCGNKPSRRDDLISLGYVFIHLPRFIVDQHWDQAGDPTHIDYPYNVYLKGIKEWSYLSCQEIPSPFRDYLEGCYQLTYEETPNYSMLKKLFTATATTATTRTTT